jgi:hypothetical protein
MKTPKESLIAFLIAFAALSTGTLAHGQSKIVGMSIACSNDHVYTWYSDRTVSEGTSENLAAYQPPHSYSLPFGKTPEDIVEIGIARNDHVYAWYRDSTLSSGTTTDLDKYQPRHPYTLPREKSVSNIVGIDIACSNDHVYVWFSGFQVTSGTTEDLDKYHEASRYAVASLKSPLMIVGIGIAGNDHVYAWYTGNTASSGTSTYLAKYRYRYDYVIGPGPCDISADPPKIDGRSVIAVGLRGPTCNSSAEVVARIRAVNPDGSLRTLIEKRVTGANFEIPLTYPCPGNEQRPTFTEVETKGRMVKSSEKTIPSCFDIATRP